MIVAIIGSPDTAAVSMMRQQIMEIDREVEIILIDRITEAAKLEKIDLVIKPDDRIQDVLKDSIMEFKLRPMDNYDYDYRDPRKFKEPKTYRSKKDRRNHR